MSVNSINDLFGIKSNKIEYKTSLVETKPKKANDVSLTEWLNSINYEKNYLLDNETSKKYSQYIINMCLYKHRDILFYIDALNILNMNNKMHYDFLLEAVPSKKRFAPFGKKQKNIEDVELVKKYFNVSYNRALKYFNQLDENDIEIIKKLYDEGGIKSKK